MEKNLLAEKIKELRNRKGYSQEYLAESTQLSLRTIQRIENGETASRGDTLNRLAKAFGIEIDELTGEQATNNNDGYLALVNLSGVACLFIYFPFFGIILPLILWLIKKDSLPDVREGGKKIINFQLTILIVYVLYLIFVVFNGIRIDAFPSLFGILGTPEIILLSVVIFPLFNAIMVIINTARILMHKEIKYWPAYRFLK